MITETFCLATGLDRGDEGGEGYERDLIRDSMMIDQPPAKSRERLRRLRRQMSPAVIDRLHASNVAGLERLYKVAWRAGR